MLRNGNIAGCEIQTGTWAAPNRATMAEKKLKEFEKGENAGFTF